MKNAILFVSLLTTSLLLVAAPASAHCEIPCGIYDDAMRLQAISEHIRTIEKSMHAIIEIENDDTPDNNQLIRWVMNKEEHARKIQEIVSQYFMTQRLKVGEENYVEKLSLLHQLLVEAMKSKQTTDLGSIEKLQKTLAAFDKLYFAPQQ